MLMLLTLFIPTNFFVCIITKIIDGNKNMSIIFEFFITDVCIIDGADPSVKYLSTKFCDFSVNNFIGNWFISSSVCG